MNILEKIIFNSAEEYAKAMDHFTIRAFKISPIWVKMHPRVFQFYANIRGFKIQHRRDGASWYNKGKEVAIMIKEGDKYKFYER